MVGSRLNLVAIERTLRAVQREFPRINKLLRSARDELAGEVIDNMMAGYALVDALVAEGTDPLTLGHLHRLLDLNALVLCGRDTRVRTGSAAHLAATEERFYEEREGALRDVVEWYKLHRHASVWKRATGIYIRVLSEPQLFIEGNHRTGALIMSHILASDGQPPFVLTVDNARAYFDPSSLIRRTNKHGFAALFRLPKLTRQFAAFLEEQADGQYLLPQPAPATAGSA